MRGYVCGSNRWQTIPPIRQRDALQTAVQAWVNPVKAVGGGKPPTQGRRRHWRFPPAGGTFHEGGAFIASYPSSISRRLFRERIPPGPERIISNRKPGFFQPPLIHIPNRPGHLEATQSISATAAANAASSRPRPGSSQRHWLLGRRQAGSALQAPGQGAHGDGVLEDVVDDLLHPSGGSWRMRTLFTSCTFNRYWPVRGACFLPRPLVPISGTRCPPETAGAIAGCSMRGGRTTGATPRHGVVN